MKVITWCDDVWRSFVDGMPSTAIYFTIQCKRSVHKACVGAENWHGHTCLVQIRPHRCWHIHMALSRHPSKRKVHVVKDRARFVGSTQQFWRTAADVILQNVCTDSANKLRCWAQGFVVRTPLHVDRRLLRPPRAFRPDALHDRAARPHASHAARLSTSPAARAPRNRSVLGRPHSHYARTQGMGWNALTWFSLRACKDV